MICSLRDDKGQTLPLFIVAAMALLFLAFALFAVGQAAVHRNSTQSAADAAALAAAQQARDDVKDDLEDAILTGDLTAIVNLLADLTPDSPGACREAGRFAARNEADVTECSPISDPPGYEVAVISRKPLGETEVEGTENKRARSEATAVIEPRCSLRENPAEPEPDPKPSPSESSEDEEEDAAAPIEFECDGDLVSMDPADLDFDIADFYSVHLRE